MNELDSVIQEFLLESLENLDQLDRDLVTLEQNPHNTEDLASIFRTIHTIKGTCGFFDFAKLGAITHSGENLLSRMRDGELTFNPPIADGLLDLVDSIREILTNIEATGNEGSADYSALVDQLTRLQVASQTFDTKLAAPSPSTEQSPSTSATPTNRLSDGNIRVDVGLLDKLMNRVGELVLARNQLLQSSALFSDAALLKTAQRLNLITSELQEGVMKTRMQPIRNIWDKFPRVVRDLAVTCGKQVRIEMDGKETELDKTIIEAIKDPLTHLVRNAVDHGIESPEIRRAKGKPVEGRLLLRAFHEGGQVNIEITDDGAGLNLERICQKAIENGLISQDQALRMNDREIAQLIFAPGFSTAVEVSTVSGRGVGMDVVKTNIENIGGTVDVQSQPGRETTIKIKIPLTLAIIPALIVTCGGNRFAIPQVSLLELVRLEGEQARKGIERLHNVPVYRLRGRLLPIVHIPQELRLECRSASRQSQASDDEIINIIVLRAGDRQFGLVVDSINDTEEIVVKPLSKQLKGIPVYAGATIMGDGKVALILDVQGMAQRARVVSEVHDRPLTDDAVHSTDQGQDRKTLVILSVANRRLALDISLVSRLEEIPRSQVEASGDQEVVQYRGRIMPLLHVGRLLGIPAEVSLDGPLQVVVHSDRDRSVGLVVDRIIDIVETTIEVTRKAQNGDLLASVVIQQRVTDLINVPSLIRRADPMFYGSPVEEAVVVA